MGQSVYRAQSNLEVCPGRWMELSNAFREGKEEGKGGGGGGVAIETEN